MECGQSRGSMSNTQWLLRSSEELGERNQCASVIELQKEEEERNVFQITTVREKTSQEGAGLHGWEDGCAEEVFSARFGVYQVAGNQAEVAGR